MRSIKISRADFCVFILFCGLAVIYFTKLHFWPWILLVIGLTGLPALYYRNRWHPEQFHMFAWLTVIPFLLFYDNRLPKHQLIEYGLLGLILTSIALLGLQTLFQGRHHHSNREHSHEGSGHHQHSRHHSHSEVRPTIDEQGRLQIHGSEHHHSSSSGRHRQDRNRRNSERNRSLYQ